MEIKCHCGNRESFVLPLWARVTFMILESGDIKILHTKPLESLEEKLVDQASLTALNCSECGSNDVAVKFGEYGQAEQNRREQLALESL